MEKGRGGDQFGGHGVLAVLAGHKKKTAKLLPPFFSTETCVKRSLLTLLPFAVHTKKTCEMLMLIS